MQSGLSLPSLRAHAACRREFSVEEVVDTSGQTKLIGWSSKAEREKEIRNRCSKTCQMNQHVNCRGCSCTVNSSTSNKYEQALRVRRGYAVSSVAVHLSMFQSLPLTHPKNRVFSISLCRMSSRKF